MNRTVKLIIPVLLFGAGCVLLCSFAAQRSRTG